MRCIEFFLVENQQNRKINKKISIKMLVGNEKRRTFAVANQNGSVMWCSLLSSVG